MIKSKLHNPIIAKNSSLENAVVEKVTSNKERIFSDLTSTTPVVPETGRIWFNTESNTFKFANKADAGNFVDEFLSRTDKREQTVVSKLNVNNTFNVANTGGKNILSVDVEKSEVLINGNSLCVKDINNNVYKIVTNHINNTFELNYSDIDLIGKIETHKISDKFIINDGLTHKLIADNATNKFSISYDSLTSTGKNVEISFDESLSFKRGTDNKILASNANDSLDINYAKVNITGNTKIKGETTLEGNVIITGDMTVGGSTTKIDIISENMNIADNVIVLNSNLKENDDPRIPVAIGGTVVDNNAGISVNRGSQGTLDIIKWVESSDTNSIETLKMGKVKISIWNNDTTTPGYELHQVVDTHTLGKTSLNESGASIVGYDGHAGSKYTQMVSSGVPTDKINQYSFKVEPSKLDVVIDSVVQEIDTLKFNNFNDVRVGETTNPGKKFTITHKLGTIYVDVKIQREENGSWYFDLLPIQVIDENKILIESAESTNIRYMISAIRGIDINQSTDLLIE